MDVNLLKAPKLGIVLAILLILSGCTYTSQITRDLNIPVQEVKKIPLRVGLYMSPNFLNYTYKESRLAEKFVFPLGETFRAGSEKIVKMAFQDVVILSALDEAIIEKLKIVISPQIQAVDIMFPMWGWGYLKSTVIIKWTAIDPTEKIIWVNTFEGESKIKGKTVKNIRNSLQVAIEDHFSKAYEGIISSTWWKSIE